MLWFTGLSGAGKSTIANRVEQKLLALGRHTMLLDGDNVRHGLNRDLGFTDTDRVENIRRVGEVARLMADAGLDRDLRLHLAVPRRPPDGARDLPRRTTFFEVFVDTPIDECIRRDPKGLYAKAQAGAIPNFTGIDSPYEPPESPGNPPGDGRRDTRSRRRPHYRGTAPARDHLTGPRLLRCARNDAPEFVIARSTPRRRSNLAEPPGARKSRLQ